MEKLQEPIRFDIRSLPLVLWQLSRFHTRESWLAWYPAIWGFAFAFSSQSPNITIPHVIFLIFSNWLCMTLIHATFCTWNDIIDSHIDTFAKRTATRPLPSGRCTIWTAFAWFITQCIISSVATRKLLGPLSFEAVLPACALAMVYPFTKRFLQWPQFVLAPSVAWPVFVGWISVSTSTGEGLRSDGSSAATTAWVHGYAAVKSHVDLSVCLPLFLAYAAWTIYFDTAYGLQDIDGDKVSGVGSLAQFLGRRYIKPFMVVLVLLTISLFALAAMRASLSLGFYVLGIAVWTATVPVQMKMLDPDDPESGGKVFGFNIMLGLWFTGVSLGEVFFRLVDFAAIL